MIFRNCRIVNLLASSVKSVRKPGGGGGFRRRALPPPGAPPLKKFENHPGPPPPPILRMNRYSIEKSKCNYLVDDDRVQLPWV